MRRELLVTAFIMSLFFQTASADLKAQKAAEESKNWNRCVELAVQNARAQALLAPWVVLSGLNCSSQSKTSVASARKLIDQVDKNPHWFFGAGWSQELQTDYYEFKFNELQSASLTPESFEEHFSSLIEKTFLLDANRSADLWKLRGDFYERLNNTPEALISYEQSLLQKDSATLRSKYEAVFQKYRGVSVRKKTEKVNPISREEEDLIIRISKLDVNADQLALLNDISVYLSKYSGGRNAKTYQDTIIKIFSDASESNSDKNFSVQTEGLKKAVNLLPPGRLLELVNVAHRRFNFDSALSLTEQALKYFDNSIQAEVFYYIGGRSAQQLGKYEKAINYFEKYEESFSAGESIAEVVFRRGLSHLRLQQFSRAREAFEKVLLIQGNDRYELSSRYYLIRSLQSLATEKDQNLFQKQITEQLDVMLEQFPFSYFSIRLLAEQKGQLTWPAEKASAPLPKGTAWLSQSQKKIWQRIKALNQEGWTGEAQREATRLFIPGHPELAAQMAQSLSELKLISPIVRLVSIAGDANPSFRTQAFLALSYPKVFSDVLAVEALKNSIDPQLVLSLVRQESAFFNLAQSSANAMGLMQLLGSTGKEVASSLNWKNFDAKMDLMNPQSNIRLGVVYLSRLLKSYDGNVPMALAAYNAGPGRLSQFRKTRPELLNELNDSKWQTELWFDEFPLFETSFYIKAILRNVLIYQILSSDSSAKVELPPVIWQNLYLKK